MSTIQKYQSEPSSFYPQFGTLRAGLLFIIAGCLIYASQEGYVSNWFWWFTLAWGGSLLVEVAVKLNISRYRSSITSPLIWGTLLVGFSYHQLYGLDEWWPLALIVIGAGIILKSVHIHDA